MDDARGVKRGPRWGRVGLLLGALAGGIALAVVLAPPVYDALTALGWERKNGFPKVLRRLLLVPPVVVFLVAFRPWRDGSLASYGLLGPRARPRPALLGAAGALGVGLLVLALQMAAGWLRWEDPIDGRDLTRRVVVYAGGGLLTGLLEEWFFRGWMVRRMGRRLPELAAVLLTALVFASLHAFKPSSLDAPVTTDVAGALEAIRGWGSHLVDPEEFGPSFAGLFLLSVLLSAAYRRTGTLWTAVGIHAAGSWLLHVYGALTDRWPPRTWAGGKWIYDGAPAWVAMVVLAAVLWCSRPPEPAPSDVR